MRRSYGRCVVIDRQPGRRETVPVAEGYTIDADVGGRWDGRADAWDVVSRTPAFARFRDAILDAASPAGEDVVVDVGCGRSARSASTPP
jgi:hypothetical protein